MNATVQPITLPTQGRTLVVSDLHARPDWLIALLDKAGFSSADSLILLGDFVEKGLQSMETLHLVMELSKQDNVYVLAGNCDVLVLDFCPKPRYDPKLMLRYLHAHPESLIHQMATQVGRDIHTVEDLLAVTPLIEETFPQELAFLRALPTILEGEHFVFVHGGVPSYDNMEELTAWRCMKNDNFMGQGHSFDRYCVVGHWPVSLYRPGVPSCAPLIDHQRRIINIDGGCSVLLEGQLNCLVIHPDQSFDWLSYDQFPTGTATQPQKASPNPTTILWLDNVVEVLEEKAEFSLCRQPNTGKELWILTSYLYQQGGLTHCQDCTDYHLQVEVGDVLSIVETTSRGYLVKCDGVVGWYLGGFEEVGL